jgi:ASC-1-like (ASCH) protein
MQEIGIETSILRQIVDGTKTVEVRLGKGKFLKLHVGDEISLREDIWQDGQIIKSIPGRTTVAVKQLLYFESFEEMLSAIDFRKTVPDAKSATEALARYRQFYSPADEHEYGAVAITFALI